MRKFTVVLLAIAFVAGFAMTASAADVSLTGQYYVKSLFEKNPALNGVSGTQEKSLSLTHQRLRVQPEVAIADGLKLVMRFDALERAWGDKNWAGSTVDSASRAANGGAVSGVAAQENIEFERAYVDFNTAVGKFMVGYQNFAAWGTAFGDSHITRPGVKYILPIKDWTIIAAFEKATSSYNGSSRTNVGMDRDMDVVDLGVVYKFNNGDAGLLYQMVRNAATRAFAADAVFNLNAFLPYYKGTFGNLYVEAEGLYAYGRGFYGAPYSSLLTATGPTGVVHSDASLEGYAAYAQAKYDCAPYYAGVMLAFVGGDDPGTTDKVEGGLAQALSYGQVFAPTHMMWNDQFMTWTGIYSKNNATMSQFLDNAYFGYVYAGWKPSAKADLKVAYAIAKADKTAYGQSKDYGSELDFTATYSIYNNLQYEVGAGYFWVGDFFKGNSSAHQVGNDYLLYHKLTLNF